MGTAAFAAAFLREFIFFSTAFDTVFTVISIIAITAAAIFSVTKPAKREKCVAAVLFMTVFLIVCNIWTVKNTNTVSTADKYSGSVENCTVYIYREPTLTSKGYYRYFGKIESPEELRDTGIIFYGFDEENISVGSRVTSSFELESGERNYYYRYNGITFFAKNKGETTVLPPDPDDINVKIGNIKTAAESKLEYLFGDVSDVVKGFLFGDTSDIDYEVKEDFRAAGISHILAVSGLHVGILSVFFFTLFSKAGHKYLKYPATAAALVLLAALSGFSPSVVRAVIMQFVVLLGTAVSRRADAKNSFGLALFLIVLFDPFIVSSPSFLLSFASTAAIVFFYKPLYSIIINFLFIRLSIRLGKFTGGLVSSVTVSVLCTVATFPISLFCFGEASYLAILGNILIFPFVTFSFVFAVAGLLISFLPLLSFFALPCAYISKIGVSLIMLSAKFVSLLTGNVSSYTLDMSFVGDWWMLLAVIAVLLAAFIIYLIVSPVKKKDKRRQIGKIRSAAIALLVIVLSIGVYFFTDNSVENIRTEGKVEVAFIDVGQGNCTVITCGDKVYVYDCGGTTEPGDRCAEYILSKGYTKIDKLIISHMHDDHMNGVRTLVSKIRTREVMIPYTSPDPKEDEELHTYLNEHNTKMIILHDDETLNLDCATINLLLGHMTENADENDNSTVLFLDFADTDVLLCGDLSKVGEKKLIAEYPTLDTDIYSVGHHGSKYSACEEFLSQITPEASVISCAKKNKYGHPSEETIARLEKYGKIYYTMDSGNIIFTLDGEKYSVETKEAA